MQYKSIFKLQDCTRNKVTAGKRWDILFKLYGATWGFTIRFKGCTARCRQTLNARPGAIPDIDEPLDAVEPTSTGTSTPTSIPADNTLTDANSSRERSRVQPLKPVK